MAKRQKSIKSMLQSNQMEKNLTSIDESQYFSSNIDKTINFVQLASKLGKIYGTHNSIG